MFKAHVHITLRTSILDPQGKTIQHALQNLGYSSVEGVRMGKYVEMVIDESDAERAREVAVESCEKLLANPVMEDYTIELAEITEDEAVSE